MQEIKAHLSKDPILKKAIKNLDPLHIPPEADLFNELVKNIAYQQISYKAADSIYSRFVSLIGLKDYLPSDILNFSEEEVKSAGFSRPKTKYIFNIAEYFEENNLYGFDWEQYSDEEIIKQLTTIKGVGEWTVHMILMFYMNRPDVFPIKDYGIQMAMKSLYKLSEDKTALLKKMNKIAEPWRPYRTHASRYLWNWKRENP